KLVDRVGPRLPLVAGAALAAAGLGLLAVPGPGGGYASTFLAPMLLLGLGMALVITPLTTTVMNAVDADRAGVASGINNAVSRGAGLLATAGVGLVVSALFARTLARRLDALALPASVRHAIAAQSSRLAAIELPPSLGAPA